MPHNKCQGHRRIKRFDIGFDDGFVCVGCGRDCTPQCDCGREAAWLVGETDFEFYCLSGRCNYRELKERGDA